MFKRTFIAGMTLAAVIGMSSSAYAAHPETLLLSGEELPVELVASEATVATQLQTPLEVLKGTGFSLKLTIHTKNTGTYSATLSGVEENVFLHKCNTEGDAEGVVLIPSNEFRLVYDALSTEGTLGVGILLSLNQLEIKCGPFKANVKGTMLGLITPINSEVAAGSNTLQGALRCLVSSGSGLGTPAESGYWQETPGTLETAKLEANYGGGSEKACLLVGTTSTSTFTLLPNKMVEIMG